MRRDTLLAFLIASAVVVTGLKYGSWVAGGMDSYGYISQSDLWRRGTLVRAEPELARVPWPGAIETLTPLGYLPGPDRQTIVPYYAPGLSMLMAVAQVIGGHCAVFWVSPICGGLLVISTFVIGRRLGSAFTGVAAAALVATSPALLFMVAAPMSDVPAAAFWGLTLVFAIAPPRRLRPWAAGFFAGLAASIAILIRSNLVPLGGVIGAWLLWRGVIRARPRRFAEVVGFVAGIVPGCIAVAIVNNAWYGSPLHTGPGSLDYLFSLDNVVANLQRYPLWFVQTETIVVALGIAGILFAGSRGSTGSTGSTGSAGRTQPPLNRLNPLNLVNLENPVWLLAFVAVTLAIHLLFAPLEDWWYLRYVLAAWPAIFAGTALLLTLAWDGRPVWMRALAIAAVVALCVIRVDIAKKRGAFETGAPERRYTAAATAVATETEPTAVVFAAQHSGTVRYYAGRFTVRYDWMDAAWLDRAIDWYVAQGIHPYLLLEEWELKQFRERFAGKSRIADLEIRTVFTYRNPAGPSVYLYDPLATPFDRAPKRLTEVHPPATCVRPAQWQTREP